jgi:uncharacterized protein
MGAAVSWFEIPAHDPQALVRFYHSAFGWTANQYPGMDYYLLDTNAKGAGISGAITGHEHLQSPATTLYVQSLDDAVRAVESNGGRVISEKMSVPNGTYAYAADPEGNVFGMLQQSNPP